MTSDKLINDQYKEIQRLKKELQDCKDQRVFWQNHANYLNSQLGILLTEVKSINGNDFKFNSSTKTTKGPGRIIQLFPKIPNSQNSGYVRKNAYL